MTNEFGLMGLIPEVPTASELQLAELNKSDDSYLETYGDSYFPVPRA